MFVTERDIDRSPRFRDHRDDGVAGVQQRFKCSLSLREVELFSMWRLEDLGVLDQLRCLEEHGDTAAHMFAEFFEVSTQHYADRDHWPIGHIEELVSTVASGLAATPKDDALRHGGLRAGAPVLLDRAVARVFVAVTVGNAIELRLVVGEQNYGVVALKAGRVVL